MPNEDTQSRLIVDGQMLLYGYVGDNLWFDGFTDKEVVEALSELEGDITVRINSGGGSVWAGNAIYNALKNHDGKVTIHIDAVAASAASIIAMAGDEIVVSEASFFMIHNAATLSWGNKEVHEKTIKMLERIDRQAVKLYARKSGMDEEEIAGLMAAETWFDADEAIESGLADRIAGSETENETDDGEATAFDYRVYQNAPEPLVALAHNRAWTFSAPDGAGQSVAAPQANASKENMKMPKATTAVKHPANTPAQTSQDDVNDSAAPSDENATVAAEQATKAERARAKAITTAVQQAGLDPAMAQEMIDEGVTADTARERVLAALAEGQGSAVVNTVRVNMGDDEVSKYREGAAKALLAKVGHKDGERNEFTSLTLSEMARMSLDRRNLDPGRTSRLEMVGAAFSPSMLGGTHSTSDFGNILMDVANKEMLRGFEEANETFQQWTRSGTLGDFKTSQRVGMGAFPSLRSVAQGAEYKYITVGDHSEPVVLATYGELFTITRQAIINDDLDAFSRVPRLMGRAAIRTVGDLVYAVITANGNMSDGKALFHADHKNLNTGAGSALSLSALSTARQAMAKQKSRDGNATLNIRPAYILAPVALGDTGRQLMASEVDPTKSNRTPNPVRGMAEVIDDARLDDNSTTAWYLATDPSSGDTVEVSYLDGEQAPMLEQQDGWKVDGTEFKVRIDAGVAPLAWEGLQKNAGA